MKLRTGTTKPALDRLGAGEAVRIGRARLRAPQAVNGDSNARAAAVEAGKVNVHLSTHYRAEFGEQLKLVGSAPELGEWDVAQAPALDWTDDHVWVADLDLPKGENIHFKVVLLSHRGVIWEPGTDRALKAQEDTSALAVKLAWGIPDIELVDAVRRPTAVAERSLSDEFDSLWDPSKAGLPADITADLGRTAAPSAEADKEPKHKHNVTLEPEWAVFDSDDEDELPVGAAEAIRAQQAGSKVSPVKTEVKTREPETQFAAANNAAEIPAPVAALSEVDDWESSGDEQDFGGEADRLKEEKSEVEKAESEEKPKKVDGLKTAGQAAGYAVAGVAAAVVLSALAVDITDAAIASAVVAAGASLLPGAKDGDGRKKAITGKGAASPILGAVELGLKAQALVTGRDKKRENKAEEKPAVKAAVEQEEEKPKPESKKRETGRDDDLLPEYVRAKAQQAEEFARGFTPTEEELFESSPPAFVRAEGFANNAVSTEGMNKNRKSGAAKKGNKVADKQQ